MKVAIFTDSFMPQVNGVTKVLDEQLKYFEKMGVEYIVFAPQYNKPFDDGAFKGKIERLPSFSFVFYKECRMSLPNHSRIKKQLEAFKPDIVHIITPFIIGFEGLKCAKAQGVPIVATYNTNYAQYMKYYYADFIKAGLWEYIRWFHSQCNMSICPSNETKKELINHGIKNIEVCPNGIDPAFFNPSKKDESLRHKYGLEGKVALLYVGRICKEKDLDILPHVMDIINAEYENQVKMIMVGDGPYTQHLKSVMPSNTIFTGYMFGEELAKLYASCDIFVFPSSTETFGNVVVEAMASGLPVVGVASGGVKDNVVSGYNGFAVPAHDVGAFASAVKMLIEDTAARKRMGYNARQYILSLAWDRVFEILMQIYVDVIKQQTVEEVEWTKSW